MYTLMLENTPVVNFDFDELSSHIVNKHLLPFYLRGALEEPNAENIRDYYRVSSKNVSLIREYASSRVLSLSRDNAKQIYAACGISQDDSIDNRVEICLACKGVSVNDGYWIKEESSSDTWESMNVRDNHLAEIVDIALGGKQPTLTTSAECPELTTKGLFKKSWIREDGELYLLKSDQMSDFTNTKAELISSKILDCTNVPHVKYTESSYEGMLVAKSKNFVLPGQSFVEAHEVIKYCRDKNIDYISYMLDCFGSSFANIPIADYILQNTDRHDQNYGFIMDNKTGVLNSVAPLFDHNQALIADWLGKDVTDTLSQMIPDGQTIQERASIMESYADISFDMEKWEALKTSIPEQAKLFKNVEKRIDQFSCIKKIENEKEINDYEER